MASGAAPSSSRTERGDGAHATLLHEARQPAVGEHLAAGLARGQYTTSCDSYDTRLRSSPHTGHGSPALPCTVKCSPSLFCRQPARRACARARGPRRAPRAIAASSRSRSSGVQRLQRRVRRELGAVQRVVGVAAADARDRALVAQDRVDAAPVGRGAQPLGELVARRFGAELRRADRRRPGRAPTNRPCVRCRTRARSTALVVGEPPAAPPSPSAWSSSAAARSRRGRPARGGTRCGAGLAVEVAGSRTSPAGRRRASVAPDELVGRRARRSSGR